MIRLAPEGRPFILGAGLLLVALLALSWVVAGWWWVSALLWLPIAIWVVAFFRDPLRDGPRGGMLVVAPADGKIVSIIPIHEPDVIGGQAIRISIFMNVFNVHVNRYPVDGPVTFRRYRPGKFFNASHEKSALENEQSDIGQASPGGPVLSRQIAGLVARRIITDHERGFVAHQGDRMGMIRFGSRVDVFVPSATVIRVKEGDVTQAGVTVIAEWT